MNDNLLSHGMTRRQFIKTSAATAAVVAISDKFIGQSQLLGNAEASVAAPNEEWVRSYCRMCVMPQCPYFVRVKDGVAVEILGDKAAFTTAGTLCARAHSVIGNEYNPYRVKTPLKRSNPQKGLEQDPKWVEISWDEAYDTVANRLKKVVSEDPRKIVLNTGYGTNKDYYGGILTAFTTMLGVPTGNTVPTNGPLCSNHHAMWMTMGNTSNAPEYVHCNYLIAVGGTQVDWAPSEGPARGFMKAIERGMQLKVVDPRCSKEASLGEWLPIRPQSELAFSLAFLNVMIHEIGLAKLDQVFLKRRSNAPYLVGAGERFYRDPATKKPMIWDPTDNKAKVFDDASIKDYALEGEFQVGDQKVTPAFALIKKEVQTYTPEWQAPLTTISADTVRRIANEFVAAAQVGSTINLDGIEFPLRPAAFFCRRAGEGSTDGHYTQITRILINGMVGALDVPGGLQGQSWGPTVIKPNEDGVVTPTSGAAGYPWKYPSDDVQLGTFYPHRHYTPFLAWRAILDPKKYGVPYDVDTILIYGSNATISNGAFEEPIAAFKKVPFIASIAYHLDESTQFADIVMPEVANLEKEITVTQGGFDKGHWDIQQATARLYRTPAVKRIGDGKQLEDILIELAKRMNLLNGKGGFIERINTSLGLKPEFAFDIAKSCSMVEIVDRDLKNTYGATKGADYFKQVGYDMKIEGPKGIYNYAYFPMGKTRYHLFFEHMKEVGDGLKANLEKNKLTVPGWDTAELMDFYRPVPHWKPMPIHKEPAEFDMYCVNWKISFLAYGLGATAENPWLYDITKNTDPYNLVIWMNPATGVKKGIKDGDTILVQSQKGKMTGKVKLTERIHPECVGVGGNYGRRSTQLNPIARDGPNYNQLLNMDDGSFSPISTALVISPKVKVTKV